MGLNFYIGCHGCRRKVFLYRLKESLPMHRFYRKHYQHGQITVEGDYQEQDWMDDYETDFEIQEDPKGRST